LLHYKKINNMAYESFEERYARQEKEREQLKLEQQLKIKKMAKLITSGIVGFFLLTFLFFSCERIDAGHVGVKVNQYGDNKGVSDVVEVTGMVFFNPITHSIYGSEFHVSPIINYSVQREKVPQIFAKYRRSLDQIEEGFLKTAVFDAFRLATNVYTADELISNRQKFEIEVRRILDGELGKEGFVITQFTSNLLYPETFKKAIEAKNNAVQGALMAENKVKQAEAEAKIKVATAQGNAQAMLTSAKAEAEANSLKQKTITPMLLQLEWINKWDGKLPVYGQAPMLYKPIN